MLLRPQRVQVLCVLTALSLWLPRAARKGREFLLQNGDVPPRECSVSRRCRDDDTHRTQCTRILFFQDLPGPSGQSALYSNYKSGSNTLHRPLRTTHPRNRSCISAWSATRSIPRRVRTLQRVLASAKAFTLPMKMAPYSLMSAVGSLRNSSFREFLIFV